MTEAPSRSSRWRSRLERVVPPLLAGALPVTLLSVGVACFILNHFFVRAPYLLDSGWYSAIVYRAGIFPDNPQIACNYAQWYYGIHVSPFVSAFSLLSYLSPWPRIEWYAFFQAMVYVPIGLATYAVASGLDRARLLYRLPITIFAALAFSFSGLVLATIGYPHYEAAIPGFICLTLAAVAAGRIRLAWVLLALALAVREDAGVHTGLALMPLLYLKLRGVAVPATRRTLIAMVAVALGTTVVMVACQKLFFHSANLLRAEYIGNPLYSHISRDLLADRADNFLQTCQFIYYPFLATCLIAALRRDARYLLGWAVTLPWFALNFLAAQEIKSAFVAYTGFPFIAAMFWVYVYGARFAPPARRFRPGVIEAIFALVCISSTIRVEQQGTRLGFLANDMQIFHRTDRAAVHGFVDALAEHRDAFGKLYVDHAIASIALEVLRPDEWWHPGATEADTVALYRNSAVVSDMVPYLVEHKLDTCTIVTGTRIVVCSRTPLPREAFGDLAIEVVPRNSISTLTR